MADNCKARASLLVVTQAGTHQTQPLLPPQRSNHIHRESSVAFVQSTVTTYLTDHIIVLLLVEVCFTDNTS